MANYKVCTKCKLTKNFEEFYKCQSAKNGLASRCKCCANQDGLDKRIKNDPNLKPKKPLSEICLAIRFPEITKQWHPTKNDGLSPHNFSYGSNRIIFWICEKKHEWDAPIKSRTTQGQGCPYCSHNRFSKEISLAVVNPAIAKEWDYTKNKEATPENVTANNSFKNFWWKCKNNHSYESRISDRIRNHGCPYCARKLATEQTSLAHTHPDLLKEWHYEKNVGINPEQVLSGTKKKVWWKCPINPKHIWPASIKSRTSLKRGCPFCSHNSVLKEDSLLIKEPNIAKEWNYEKNKDLTPDQVGIHSNKNVFWKCSMGHEWENKIHARTLYKAPCPHCYMVENCLLNKMPELCKEWDYERNKNLVPENVTSFSGKRVFWKCRQGHKWEAIISSRSLGKGCPYCNGILLKDGALCNSMPEAIKYLDYIEKGLTFEHNKKYHAKFGNRRYDFFFKDDNKYVEVTSYNFKNMKKNRLKMYRNYLRKIVKKRRFVENVLGAQFEFIQFTPTKEQIQKVREYMA